MWLKSGFGGGKSLVAGGRGGPTLLELPPTPFAYVLRVAKPSLRSSAVTGILSRNSSTPFDEPGVGGSRSELGYPAAESEPPRRRDGGRSRVTAPGGSGAKAL